MGAFSSGVPIFVSVLTNTMWLLKSKWVPIFMWCLFVWVLIIPILRYCYTIITAVSPIMAVHYYDATVPQQSVLTLNSNMIRTNLLNHVSALGTFAYDCCISLWSVHYCDLFTKTITMAAWRYDRNSSSSGTV